MDWNEFLMKFTDQSAHTRDHGVIGWRIHIHIIWSSDLDLNAQGFGRQGEEQG